MQKLNVKLSLLVFALLVSWGSGLLPHALEMAEAAQTIRGTAIGNVDDVVKQLNGELTLAKKGLITIRGGNDRGGGQAHTYVDVFASVFSRDATPSKARQVSVPNSGPYVVDLDQGFFDAPNYFAPAVSRRLYNGKRVFMFHNIANNGELNYYFHTLSNTLSSDAVGKTPDKLIDSVRISNGAVYTPKAIPTSKDIKDISFAVKIWGTGVMEVKGYENEIFVVATGGNPPGVADKTIRLEFFAISADSEGNILPEPLTTLTHETPFRDVYGAKLGRDVEGGARIVSLAVGDFDGDKYNNEVALTITSRQELRLFVYRLMSSKGNLELRSLGDPKGLLVHSTNQWGATIEDQPVTDMVAGDFDGDGTSEIAVFFKTIWRATGLKHHKGWPDGPKVGDIHCRVHKWNAEKGAFDTAETIKDYHGEKKDINPRRLTPDDYTLATGVVGLRAVTADLNGDGRDEIATVILGYCHRKDWNVRVRYNHFFVFPHLAVWKFENGITPIHDDAHVKGGLPDNDTYTSDYTGPKYDFGPVYELIKNQKTPLLEDQPLYKYHYHIGQLPYEDDDDEVRNYAPDRIHYMFALQNVSITAGPFTGTLGTFKTVDDIAIAWKDKKGGYIPEHWYDTTGNDCVKIFKTKVTNVGSSKEFDGFEDGKLVLQNKSSADYRATFRDNTGTLRGLVAVDLASEGVELGRPLHLKRQENRSYIAALSAIPYHVDTINSTGSALSEQPTNFTYSDPSNGGNMTVSYGKTTTDTNTKNVQQDLSYSIETMFAADPEAKGASAFSKVKGAIGFASAIGNIYSAVQLSRLTTEQKRELVWKEEPGTPLDLLQGLMDFFSDRVDKIHQKASTDITTVLIDKTITATTNDVILFTENARHIWRYPVLTRPLPMWLASGPRIDSTQIENPGTVSGDKQLFITFTMSENTELNTATSLTDSQYQPLHEEGNFFSYPPNIADVESYNASGLLTKEASTWSFSNTIDNSGITFTEARSNMQHTETKVTPGPFTSTIRFFERLFKGDNAKSVIKQPNSDNPKTFTKEYNKTENIRYTLQGSKSLTNSTADHRVKMQPFVAKEGAMTFVTAVALDTDHNARLWNRNSLYQQKPDPSLLLPFKFVSSATGFVAMNDDAIAMQIRGVKFYMPDFAFFTDNRLLNGQNYEIRVPIYNASFKATSRDFKVRLSYTTDNTLAGIANRKLIGETTMSLGGWSNVSNNNKGLAVFNWTPNLDTSKQLQEKQQNYYFYVELDSGGALDEVHEARYSASRKQGGGSEAPEGGSEAPEGGSEAPEGGSEAPEGGSEAPYDDFFGLFGASDSDTALDSGSTVSDYGGNNTGFYPFYIYNANDPIINTSGFRAAADEMQIIPMYFTDGNGNRINDMAQFILAHQDESFVPITANFTYRGPETPYATFGGYVLTQSGKQKVPSAGINTIVNLNTLSPGDVNDVFMLQDLALYNGNHQVTFVISPTELINDAENIITNAHLITFGIKTFTMGEEVISSDEEFYEGEDPYFELDPIPDDIVSSVAVETYSLNSNENVFWLISDVKFNGTSPASDDIDLLDIELEVIDPTSASGDISPVDYGNNATVTVSALAGYTPRGTYEITVQRSVDGDEWTTARVLTFDTEASGGTGGDTYSYDDGDNKSSSGCNAGMNLGTLALLLCGFAALRRKN